MNTREKKLNLTTITKISLLLICIISLTSKLFYGFDIDEQYCLSMVYRLNNGNLPFINMWDPHLMSSFFLCPIFHLYNFIFPDYSYLVLFIRIVSLSIQIAISYFIYTEFKNNVSQKNAYLAFFAYLIFLPKQTLIIEHSNLTNWFSTLCILFLFKYTYTKNKVNIIVSSIFLALTSLSYPTQALLLFLIMLILFFVFKDKKAAILFLIPCSLMGSAFIIFFIYKYGFNNFFSNVFMIFTEGSHQTNTVIRIFKTLSSFCFIVLINVVFSFFTTLIGKKIFNKSFDELFVSSFILFWPICIFTISIIGIVWPPLSMYRRFLLISIISIFLYYKNKRSYHEFILFSVPIFMMIISLLTSNLGIDSACGSISLLFTYSVCVIADSLNYKIVKVSLIMFIVSHCFVVSLSPRITKTPGYPIKNLTNTSLPILRTTHITNEDDALFNDMIKIKNIVQNKNVAYIGGNSIFYLLTNSNAVVPTTISTPVFDKQWVKYYKDFNNVIPEYLVLEKEEFRTIKDFLNTPLGQYLSQFNFSLVKDENHLKLYRIY